MGETPGNGTSDPPCDQVASAQSSQYLFRKDGRKGEVFEKRRRSAAQLPAIVGIDLALEQGGSEA